MHGQPDKKIRMFENRVVRIIFEPKRKDVLGDWRKSYNEEFVIYPVSGNIIRANK
jgi:hypothetical protein